MNNINSTTEKKREPTHHYHTGLEVVMSRGPMYVSQSYYFLIQKTV
jgi:hypothetical protein